MNEEDSSKRWWNKVFQLFYTMGEDAEAVLRRSLDRIIPSWM